MRIQTVFLPTAALGAAVIFLSACSGASQSNTLRLPQTSAGVNSSVVRPTFQDAAFVKVKFHNNWGQKLTAQTLYSYPILPTYFVVQQQCVEPNSDWTSEIGFQYPDGQVAVKVLNDNCVHNPSSPKGTIYFTSIQFSHADPERATITSDVTPNFVLKLCGRQTDPIRGKLECAHF